MSKITVVETFVSQNGEGLYINGRTESAVWVRVARCPFTCSKFNNPTNIDPASDEALGFRPEDIKSLDEMPEITIGCDSIYAHNDRFKHLWTDWPVEDLAKHLVSLVPAGGATWQHPVSKQRYGLTFTGGEPVSFFKAIVDLLHQPEFDELRTVTFETNCAVPPNPRAVARLKTWCEAVPGRQIIWSNSPKLSNSGEPWEKAIVPGNALYQRLVGEGNYKQYFKFVVQPNEASFAEVQKAMAAYHAGGIPEDAEVCCMPEGASVEQQQEIDAAVAKMAMQYGYHISFRSHLYAFGNKPGV